MVVVAAEAVAASAAVSAATQEAAVTAGHRAPTHYPHFNAVDRGLCKPFRRPHLWHRPGHRRRSPESGPSSQSDSGEDIVPLRAMVVIFCAVSLE